MSAVQDARQAAGILVVDDEEGYRKLLSWELGARGYRVVTASSGREALERVRAERFPLVICDIRMPGMDGIEILEAVKKADLEAEVIMATGYATIETAVLAIKRGAYDFIQKPFLLDKLFALVDRAMEKRELKAITAVYEASRAVFASLKLEELLPLVAGLARKVVGADEVSIMLLDAEGRLEVRAAAGIEASPRTLSTVRLGERVGGRVAQWNVPVIISGPLENDPRFQGVPSLRPIKSSLVCPLSAGGEVLGVIDANRTRVEEPFTEADLRLFVILGSQVAQAVRNAQLYQQLEEKVGELDRATGRLEELRAQLLRADRLATVGELAATVLHELNNPLTAVTAFSEALARAPDLPARLREDVEGIRGQAERCASVATKLLRLGRREPPSRRPTDLVRLVDDALELERYSLRKASVTVTRSFEPGLPAVQADPLQLQQVFLNLICNALHAMEGRGAGRLEVEVRREGDRLVARFADDGCGIAPGDLGRIFDPFFTTKPTSKGTGLGLSISRGIVVDHGGELTVESRSGAGATFTVALPKG